MTSTEPGVLLRRADDDDAAGIAAVYVAARRAAPMPDDPQTEEAVRAWVSRRLQGTDETWVAEVDGRVAGYARVVGSWLDDLYVAPAATGQGIGSALLDLVKSLRPDGFCLWVFETNAPARRFYAARGLVELEHTPGPPGDAGAPDIRLAWPGERPVDFLRRLVDEVDDDLGMLLERRSALTRAIQAYKPVGGPAGRDARRERRIAERMATRSPSLGPDRLQRIVHVVITESLDAAGTTEPADGDRQGG